jgi:hypothetical protein
VGGRRGFRRTRGDRFFRFAANFEANGRFSEARGTAGAIPSSPLRTLLPSNRLACLTGLRAADRCPATALRRLPFEEDRARFKQRTQANRALVG